MIKAKDVLLHLERLWYRFEQLPPWPLFWVGLGLGASGAWWFLFRVADERGLLGLALLLVTGVSLALAARPVVVPDRRHRATIGVHLTTGLTRARVTLQRSGSNIVHRWDSLWRVSRAAVVRASVVVLARLAPAWEQVRQVNRHRPLPSSPSDSAQPATGRSPSSAALLDMVSLPGGTFMMGSPDSDPLAREEEKPQHPVTLSAFSISRTPITRGQYRAVMGDEACPQDWGRGPTLDPELPANYLSWDAAVAFCNRLSEREDFTSCYRIEGKQVTWIDRASDGYRLPTEAEWEYACRASTTTPWFFGEDPKDLSRYAWFHDNADGVRSVGRKQPNRWRLHDMIGNLWEWCWDRFSDYQAEALENPQGPPLEPSGRVLRGGSFYDSPWVLRSADRDWNKPEVGGKRRGFRCVRVPARH